MDPDDKEAAIRRYFDAWNADDWTVIESTFTPEAEVVAPDGWPEPGPFKGWPAVRAQFERLKSSWAEERVASVELEPVGDTLVVARGDWVTRGQASGAEVSHPFAIIFHFERTKASKAEFFFDPEAVDAALEALGGPG